MSLTPETLALLWRYGKVGLLNTAFGYGLYAALVALGLSMYVAQIVGHVIAVAFNYVTYSRHVFAETPGSKLRFIGSYALNYLVSLASLAAAATVIRSPYLAGAVAVVFTAALNFFVLRRFVFAGAPETAHA